MAACICVEPDERDEPMTNKNLTPTDRQLPPGGFLVRRISGVLVLCCALCVPAAAADQAAQKDGQANSPIAAAARVKLPVRPRVPGTFAVRLRGREKQADGSWLPKPRTEQWKVHETAIIICDMWDGHYCLLAAQRVDAMAPRMNRVLTAARAHGALIVHAPSGCMDKYELTPFRLRAQNAPHVKPPVEIAGWCYLDPETEAEMPVDVSSQPCDDPVVGEAVRRFSRQHEAIRLIGYDAVSDNGQEIYNLFVQEGIRNVVLMGVHTNMCVLGRPFGIRQMTRLGFNVALARDLTDAMYDPREKPYVSHTRGTELVIEHIEKYWCPSLLGRDLTRVVTGSNDPQPVGDSAASTAEGSR